MPTLSSELKVGVFTELYRSLDHFVVKADDVKLDNLTARFFLSLSELGKENFQIGQDRYDNKGKLEADAEAAINLVKAHLKNISGATQSKQAELTDKFIKQLKTIGNSTTNPTNLTNTPESITLWEKFIGRILAEQPSTQTTLDALRAVIKNEEFLALSLKLRRQTDGANADEEKDNFAKRSQYDKEEAAKRKTEMEGVFKNVNVRNLIKQFEEKIKGGITPPKKDDKNARERREKERKEREERERKEREERERKEREEQARKDKEERDRKDKEEKDRKGSEKTESKGSEESAPLTNESQVNETRRAATMHQQPLSETVVSEPAIKINNTRQVEEILAVAQHANNTQQIKDVGSQLSHFSNQALLANEPTAASLELRQNLLHEWNDTLLPLQSQLLDRIATLQVLETALNNAKTFIQNSNDPDLSTKEIDQQLAESKKGLAQYQSLLNEINNIEVGLSKTNVTVYHDPDFEGQTVVAATVVKKILASEDRAAILAAIRNDLGIKQAERNLGANGLVLTTDKKYDYERDKIDTTRHYTLLGFIGFDNHGLNSAHDNITSVALQSNLNTVYSLSALANDRNNFTLQVVDLREDFDPTHLLVKFVTNTHADFGNLAGQFSGISNEPDKMVSELYQLFSQLGQRIPEVKVLEGFLNQFMQPSDSASPGKVAKAMHAELIRVLRNAKYPDVPSNEALRFAEDAVQKVISGTDGQQTMIIHGKNAEMRRAMKYYCVMMQQQFKDFPDKQKGYIYFDPLDPFDKQRPVLKGGLLSGISLFRVKDKEDKSLLKNFNQEGRRVVKELMHDKREFDEQVFSPTQFKEDIAAQKSRAKNLGKLTTALETTNSEIGDSAFLKDAFAAAKSNARTAQRLPEATTAQPVLAQGRSH